MKPEQLFLVDSCCCGSSAATGGTIADERAVAEFKFAVEIVWRSCCGFKNMWIGAFVDTK